MGRSGEDECKRCRDGIPAGGQNEIPHARAGYRDRRWAVEARRRGRRPAQEKRRGQPAIWKRDEGGREKWEGRWIFIALRKAAGEAMQGHLAG